MSRRREVHTGPVRWKGKVRLEALTSDQLLARLGWLRRQLALSYRQDPSAREEHERWRRFIQRYEELVDRCPK